MKRRLWLALAFFMGACPAKADPFIYSNARFGTTATFPDEVFSQALPSPENGDGQSWRAVDGATLAIYGSYNVMDYSPDELAASVTRRDVADFEVTYQKVGGNWAVVSGYEGDMIFYERYEIRKDDGIDVIDGLRIVYPKARRAVYDNLAASIAATLSGP